MLITYLFKWINFYVTTFTILSHICPWIGRHPCSIAFRTLIFTKTSSWSLIRCFTWLILKKKNNQINYDRINKNEKLQQHTFILNLDFFSLQFVTNHANVKTNHKLFRFIWIQRFFIFVYINTCILSNVQDCSNVT